VAVVIVNWNTRRLLEVCLECLFESVPAPLSEVIVVDNASTDGSVAMLREKFPAVKRILNPENVGFARAVNQGIRCSQAEYVLLLNTDAFVHPQAVATLVRVMEENPDVGAAGPRLYYADGSLQRACFQFPTLWTETWRCLGIDRLFPRSRILGAYQMTYWDLDDTRDVDTIMGACLLLRRKALDQVGLLDERFFMFSEEVDLCYRLKGANWKTRFVHMAEVTHLWGGSSRVVPQKSFLELHKSRVMFFRKHYGSGNAALLKLILWVSGVTRGVAGWLVGMVIRKPGIQQKTLNYLHLSSSLWPF
jgi:GT2 family glycosyltransferase